MANLVKMAKWYGGMVQVRFACRISIIWQNPQKKSVSHHGIHSRRKYIIHIEAEVDVIYVYLHMAPFKVST